MECFGLATAIVKEETTTMEGDFLLGARHKIIVCVMSLHLRQDVVGAPKVTLLGTVDGDVRA